MANQGLGGAALFAIGGTILFLLSIVFLSNASSNSGIPFPMAAFLSVIIFIGFLTLGLGLWIIIEAGIRGAKQNTSQAL